MISVKITSSSSASYCEKHLTSVVLSGPCSLTPIRENTQLVPTHIRETPQKDVQPPGTGKPSISLHDQEVSQQHTRVKQPSFTDITLLNMTGFRLPITQTCALACCWAEHLPAAGLSRSNMACAALTGVDLDVTSDTTAMAPQVTHGHIKPLLAPSQDFLPIADEV